MLNMFCTLFPNYRNPAINIDPLLHISIYCEDAIYNPKGTFHYQLLREDIQNAFIHVIGLKDTSYHIVRELCHIGELYLCPTYNAIYHVYIHHTSGQSGL